MTVATTPETGAHRAAAVVHGTPVEVPCPSWCTADHAAIGTRELENVAHSSDSVWMTAPVGVAGRAEILHAFVSQYPFSDGHTEPVLALDAVDSDEFAEMTAAQALAFADQLVAHADQIRRLAIRMVG